MQSLTQKLIDSSFSHGLIQGVKGSKEVVKTAKETWESIRKEYGLAGSPDLLTAPDGNIKLDKSAVPTYGLTLQHYVQKLHSGLVVNACPSAGDCVKVCVLDNGNGYYPKVQTARRARTEFFAEEPEAAGVLLGYELQRAIIKHTKILFRPNVNSDVEWHKIVPDLTEGRLFGDAVHSYGYSKLDSTLVEKVNTPFYTVAYSANEKSDWTKVRKFLRNGGNVAVVTSRKPKTPIFQWYKGATVVDADATDEWMLGGKGLIGDLSAKGKARQLIGVSNFIKEI